MNDNSGEERAIERLLEVTKDLRTSIDELFWWTVTLTFLTAVILVLTIVLVLHG